MGDAAPSTAQEIAGFRSRVDKAPNVQAFLISADETATLITATFIERLLDFGETFEFIQALVEREQDDQHEIYIAGAPVLTGWVYTYQAQMLGIFAITVIALFASLVFYMRNVPGVLTPIVVSLVAAIWGFGFVGWVGDPIEPLIMVVPLLLSFFPAPKNVKALLGTDETARAHRRIFALLHAIGRLSHGAQARKTALTILFVTPNDVRGTSFLNIWPYDQNRFPELYGYLPAFKRVRRFPTNQRFEPLITGNTLYLSDAWAAGDPFLTWGNYRVVHRGPCLAAVARTWNSEHPNWEHSTHGGAEGKTFWDTDVQLVPEAIVVEAQPLRYPRAPVSRKRVWFDRPDPHAPVDGVLRSPRRDLQVFRWREWHLIKPK